MSVVSRFASAHRRQAVLFRDLPLPERARGELSPPAPRPRRIELLRERLPAVVTQLERRRLDLVEEGFVADYLALRWLVWCDGDLRLSEIGRIVSDSAQAEATAPRAGSPASAVSAEPARRKA